MAFGQGPGGFTGLRVACGVAQGMALGLDIPVLPVVSHLAVAAQTGAAPGQAVLVALDARMNEVYLAVYRRAGTEGDEPASWETLQEPMLIAAAEVVPWAQHHQSGWRLGAPLLIAGDAWDAYAADMAPPPAWQRVDVLRPEAASVARLARQDWLRGQSVPAELAAPLYVRDKVAFTTAERMRGEGGNPKARRAIPATPQPLTDADLDEVVALEANVQSFPGRVAISPMRWRPAMAPGPCARKAGWRVSVSSCSRRMSPICW